MSSDKEHYHLALFFSGHKVNYPQKVLLEVQQAWNSFCQGTVKLVKSPFYMMNRGDKSSINPVIYRLSYLTKNHTKDRNGKAKSYIVECLNSCRKKLINVTNKLLVDPEVTCHKRLIKLANCFNWPTIRRTSTTKNNSTQKHRGFNRAGQLLHLEGTCNLKLINEQITHHLEELKVLFDASQQLANFMGFSESGNHSHG